MNPIYWAYDDSLPADDSYMGEFSAGSVEQAVARAAMWWPSARIRLWCDGWVASTLAVAVAG